ncbi:hypothetical protein M2326_001517 [Flavobacterium sp. 7A]|nr:hypothetical protein [Flavobacterium sp. 7A]
MHSPDCNGNTLKRNCVFSGRNKATRGSSCGDLRKKQLLDKYCSGKQEFAPEKYYIYLN